MPYLSLDEEVQALFAWNPSSVYPRDDIRVFGSEDSLASDDEKKPRLSDFYNQHISEQLSVKHVVHVPDLHRRIAHQASLALQARKDSGVTLGYKGGFHPSTAVRNHSTPAEIGVPLEDASRLEKLYGDTIAEYCMPMASALALHPRRWFPLTMWAAQPARRAFAASNGSIQMIPGANPKKPNAMDNFMVDPEKRTDFAVAYNTFRDLTTLEIPSLLEANKDVMFALHLLISGKAEDIPFQWDKASDLVTRAASDAEIVHAPFDTIDSAELLRLTIGPWDDPFKGGGETLSQSRQAARQASKLSRQSARRAVLEEALHRGGSSLEQCNAMDETFWAGDPRRPISSSAELKNKASHLLQKAWADSVRHRSSIFVIHSGNYEFIGIRHRGTQTLYISDILHVPRMTSPGYGQVTVGHYYLAFDDALRRAAILEDGKTNDDGDAITSIPSSPSASTPVTQTQTVRGLKIWNAAEPRKFEVVEPDASISTNDTDIKAINRQVMHRTVMLAYFRFGIYHSAAPTVFQRGRNTRSQRSTLPRGVSSPQDRFFINLSSPIGYGATGVAHRGTMKIELNDRVVAHGVVAKLAFSQDQRDDLEEEYKLYEHLASRRATGVPVCYGLFADVKSGGPSCLLLSDAGVTVAERNKKFSLAERDAFLSILASIHRAGVLHGDVVRDGNLLFDYENRPTIIDFSHSRRNVSDDHYAAEYNGFEEYLDKHLTESARVELEFAQNTGDKPSKRNADAVPGNSNAKRSRQKSVPSKKSSRLDRRLEARPQRGPSRRH